jgi:ribonucleoside-diphosphate reductase alpha chain
VRFLDDVIDVNNYPIPEIEHMARGNRKIGLGVMGFAEMLIRLGISYDSNQAIAVAGRVMEFINNEALVASQQLAEERGVFPFWKESIHASRGLRLHNTTRTAIAPTGTIGIIAGTSASIEPLFALAYRRSHVLGAETLYEINPLLVEFAEHRGLDVHRMAKKSAKRAASPPSLARRKTLGDSSSPLLKFPPNATCKSKPPSSSKWTTRFPRLSIYRTTRNLRILDGCISARGNWV